MKCKCGQWCVSFNPVTKQHARTQLILNFYEIKKETKLNATRCFRVVVSFHPQYQELREIIKNDLSLAYKVD